MRRAFAPILFIAVGIGCFDFTATVEAEVGGRCGDLDHYCAEGLDCIQNVCTRDGGSLTGEMCSTRLGCSDGLACVSNRCAPGCGEPECAGQGTCVVEATRTYCECEPGFVSELTTCAGDNDTACSDALPCRRGLSCEAGFCAEACSGLICRGGTVCNSVLTPPICECPVGTRLEGNQCVSVCAGVACSAPLGRCVVSASGERSCECDPPYIPDGLNCTGQPCTPNGETTTRCDGGQLYRVDSCNNLIDQFRECGTLGCNGTTCNEPSWQTRDIALGDVATGDVLVRSWSDVLAVTGAVVVQPYSSAAITIRQYNGSSWLAFGGGTVTLAQAPRQGLRTLQSLSLTADGSGQPGVGYVSHAFSSGTTPVPWRDDVFYAQWDGASWTYPGVSNQELGVSQSQTTTSSHVAVSYGSGTNLLAAWAEDTGSGYRPLVKRLSGTWAHYDVPDAVQVSGESSPPALAWLGAVPVVAWATGGSGSQVYVVAWNGSSWSPLIAPFAGARPSLVVDGSTLSMAWQASGEIFFSEWNGTAWGGPRAITSGGGLSNTAADSRAPKVGIDQWHRPVVAWVENTGAATGVFVKCWRDAWQSCGVGAAENRGIATDLGTFEATTAVSLSARGDTACVAWANNTERYFVRCARF